MSTFVSGMIIGIESPGIVSFQWNPKTIKQAKTVPWAALKPAGREAPIFHYGCGEATKYTFEAEFSQSNNSPQYVKAMGEALRRFAKPTVMGAGLWRPPAIQLILGSFLNVTGILTQIGGEYGPLFHPHSLLPKDGTLSITVTEII